MGIGLVWVFNQVLVKVGFMMDDMDIIEFNEVFVAQALACIWQWGIVDDDLCINLNGGVIVIGYLLGMIGICLL